MKARYENLVYIFGTFAMALSCGSAPHRDYLTGRMNRDDAKQMASDWKAVGQDIKKATEVVADEQRSEASKSV